MAPETDPFLFTETSADDIEGRKAGRSWSSGVRALVRDLEALKRQVQAASPDGEQIKRTLARLGKATGDLDGRPGNPVSFEPSVRADPVRVAFRRRSIGALDRIAATASVESLAEALAAPTDVGTVARAIGDSEVIGAAIMSLEPLAPLMARNAEHRRELVEAAAGMLTVSEVADFLDITRQAVDKRRRSNRLLGLRQGGDWLYPRCQFDEGRHDVVLDLPRFLLEAGLANPWVALDLLLSSDDALEGRAPLDVLRADGWTEALARLVRIERGDGFA